MNTNLQPIKEQQSLKKKAIALLSKAIAKIILKFRLPRAEIINALDEQLVLEAKKQDPDASQVTIAIRTGINRRHIPKYLNGEMPSAKPDKLAVILEDIRWTAHKYYNSTKLPKVGHFRTFQSICEQRASGTLTFHAILDELVKNGNLKDLGSNVELLKLGGSIQRNEINYSQLTATQLNRVVDTIIYNSDIIIFEDKYVQSTVYSTQINPIKFNDLHQDILYKIKKYKAEIGDLLISYEEDVNVGTYSEYGLSFLEYKIEE